MPVTISAVPCFNFPASPETPPVDRYRVPKIDGPAGPGGGESMRALLRAMLGGYFLSIAALRAISLFCSFRCSCQALPRSAAALAPLIASCFVLPTPAPST